MGIKFEKSLWVAIKVGFRFIQWLEESARDRVIDKAEQKALFSELLELAGNTDIRLDKDDND